MSLKDFYNQRSNTSEYKIASRTNIFGERFRDKFLAYDDRFKIVVDALSDLITQIGTKKKIKILDVGCGDGVYEKKIAGRYKNLNFYGADISINQLSNTENLFKQIKIVDVDNQRLPYPSQKFDIIICSEILEHLFWPDRLVSEISRLLKPRGALLVTVPNYGSLQIRIKTLFAGYSPMVNFTNNKDHIRFYSPIDIKKLFSNKFKIISIKGVGSLYFSDWNFGFKIPLPRFIQLLFNQTMPSLANGIIAIFQRK